MIPLAVSREIGRRTEGFSSGRPEWLRHVAVKESSLADTLRLTVDAGEAEAITLASQLQTRLIIDDVAGRRVADSLGIEVTGTLGVLLLAKQRSLVERVDTLINALLSEDFYLSAPLVAEVLRLAQEDA